MSINLSDFEDARHFFSCVRDASIEAERTRLTLLRMEASEGVRAQCYEATGRSGHRADAMARTDSRIDYEERMRERIEADYELIDLACRVLYGEESGKGGVEALMGSAVADCLSFRYVDARPWREVSDYTGYSVSQCKRLCVLGFDAVDSIECSMIINGDGIAEV